MESGWWTSSPQRLLPSAGGIDLLQQTSCSSWLALLTDHTFWWNSLGSPMMRRSILPKSLTQGPYLYHCVSELYILGRGVSKTEQLANGLEHPWQKENPIKSKSVALRSNTCFDTLTNPTQAHSQGSCPGQRLR